MMRSLEIKVDPSPVEYLEALKRQEARVCDILERPSAPYILNFLEHRPVLTTGRTFEPQHLLASPQGLQEKGIEVVAVSRGGSVTYHGPGQLTVYLHVHLKELGLGLTTLMRDLEQWVMDSLGDLGLESFREPGKTGVWTEKGKICAMGVAARKFVTYHGIGLNIRVDREAFSLIVPCGLSEPVASLNQFFHEPATKEKVIETMLANLPPWLGQLRITQKG